MSIAVLNERFILTAYRLSDNIVGTYSLARKQGAHVMSGGDS